MTIEAPLSRYKKNNILMIAGILLVAAVWFWYDGHYSQKFIDEHTKDGQPDGTLVFNQKSPPFMLAGAFFLGVWFWTIKDKKIVADNSELKCEKQIIKINQIESIDKTHFDSKGFFVIGYKDDNQQSRQLKLSDKKYDNLGAILDHLTAKMAE